MLGGTYFLGRAFVEAAAGEHQLTLVNRGSRPLAVSGVTEYHMDRHDGGLVEELGLRYTELPQGMRRTFEQYLDAEGRSHGY